MARALPAGGKLVTLEADPRHAEVAQKNIKLAGLEKTIELHIGPAAETLAVLSHDAPFDLIFIDADKPNNPVYLEWALEYSRPGTLIIGDNVVRDGEVAQPRQRRRSRAGRENLYRIDGKQPKPFCHRPTNGRQ
ncbi:Putative O-methyltransferase MSMEG_5073 [Cedecea neteri]|uniref:O-methyltransferase MSMEG_5073 n=1 Tax=Cedecea neteri TaxID=158822 RepID=A0A2X3J1F0_9ENTR|nr:Putative O-methyltransferase MSMEG_5073 [Cedecea neteri]